MDWKTFTIFEADEDTVLYHTRDGKRYFLTHEEYVDLGEPITLELRPDPIDEIWNLALKVVEYGE